MHQLSITVRKKLEDYAYRLRKIPQLISSLTSARIEVFQYNTAIL